MSCLSILLTWNSRSSSQCGYGLGCNCGYGFGANCVWSLCFVVCGVLIGLVEPTGGVGRLASGMVRQRSGRAGRGSDIVGTRVRDLA